MMAQTQGQQLKQIRESRGISIEEISQKTRIRLAYLEAIEADEFDTLPSKTQLRGFLRLYASVLDINLDELQTEGYHLTKGKEPEEKLPVSQQSELAQPEIIEDISPSTEPGTEATDFPPDSASTAALEKLEIALPQDAGSAAPQNAIALFSAIGLQIRNRRELLSLSIDDIHKTLHIRKQFLTAIEAGHFDLLPSPVQAKGLLSNYAEFLNLDLESIMLRYADALQMQRIEKQGLAESSGEKSVRELSTTRLKLKNFFSLDLLVIGTLFIAFAIFVIWGVNRILAVDTEDQAAAALPEVSDILLATGTPTPQLEITSVETFGEDENQNSTQNVESPLFTPAPDTSPINIVIIPRQRIWVQVTSDSELVYEGRLIPGNAYNYSGQDSLEILTGNAGAMQIIFNSQDIGSPGLIGQVVNLIFTESGLILPTPTITPTPTETPQTTPTPSVTPSPTFTPVNNDD